MNEISEEIIIMTAASLAGKEAPEVLPEERARRFVTDKLGNVSEKGERRVIFRPVYVWSGIAIAAVVCAVAVFLFRPSPGNPEALMPVEMYSTHASADVADSLAACDSVELSVVETEVVE